MLMPLCNTHCLSLYCRMLQTAYDYFWWHRLWLPENLTWADLDDKDGRVYAKASDLYITIPLAFVFLVVRYVFEM